MNKNEYLSALRKRLKKMPDSDRADVMRFYEEYFEEAGPDMEEKVIVELGPPVAVASQLMSQYIVDTYEEEGAVKKGWNALKIGLLAVLLSPVGIVAFVLILVLLITVFAVLVSFFTAAISVFAAGLTGILCSFVLWGLSVPTALFFLGFGLFGLGFGYVCFRGTTKLSTICFRGITLGLNRFGAKKNKQPYARQERGGEE